MTNARKRKPARFRWSRVGTGVVAAGLFVLFWGAIAATAGPDGAPASANRSGAAEVIVIDRRMLERLAAGEDVRVGEPVATAPVRSAQRAKTSRAS